MNKTHYALRANLLLAMLLSINISQAAPPLNATQDRISDPATYTATQARIAALNSKGIPVADYALSKAQCWLDVSLHEYTRNDRSSFTQEAFNESDRILTALEHNAQTDPAESASLIKNADKLREDLWAKLAQLKQSKGLVCYARQAACAEVELVHAANENQQQGWRHANPYVQMAEELVAQAQATGERCIVAPVAVASAPVSVEPAPLPEKINLAADALFQFNKATDDDLLLAGKQILDALVAKLNNEYVRIDRIQLFGYTDRLGSAAYNQKLSEQRALTVKQYLQNQGVTAVIEAQGRGEVDMVDACGTSYKPTKALVDCLQVNRRVSIEVTGVKGMTQGDSNPQLSAKPNSQKSRELSILENYEWSPTLVTFNPNPSDFLRR